MSFTQTVTSPFIQNLHQLFYAATLNTQNNKITIKVFNHKGVQKSRRQLTSPAQICQIFAADKYLIGFDTSHCKVCIIDITKYANFIVKGYVPDQNGLHKEMQEKKLKFTFFCYDEKVNMIFGLLNNHDVFYFNVKRFDKKGRNQQQDLQDGQSQNSYTTSDNLSIQKLYHSAESIDKFEIRNTKRQKKINSPKKKSFIPKLQGSFINSSFISDQPSFQDVCEMCLLIRQKKFLRTVQIDWIHDSTLKISHTVDVYDFCFRNGWELIIKYTQTKMKKKSQSKIVEQPNQPKQPKYELIFTTKGQYYADIKMSDQHIIFTSDESLLIVDPGNQTITGIHHKQFRNVYNVASIPHGMTTSNTLFMVQRPEQRYIRYLFQVYNFDKDCIDYKPIIVPIYNTQNAQEPQYLAKNIEKVFSINGLIHPHYRQKVQKWINNQRRQQSDNSRDYLIENSGMSRISQNQMRRQDDHNNQNQFKQNNPTDLAKKFFESFVMVNQNLTDRFLTNLINYGLKHLFSGKQRSDSKMISSMLKSSKLPKTSKSPQKHQTQVSYASGISPHIKSVSFDLSCNFDRWNQYFEQMISKSMSLLKIFSVPQLEQKKSSDQQFRQKIIQIFQQNQRIKQKLAAISNIYNRLLKALPGATFGGQDKKVKKIIEHNKEKIIRNISVCKSLFLVFDMFYMVKDYKRNQRRSIINSQMKCLEEMLEEMFAGFQRQREENVVTYKFKLASQSNQMKIINPSHKLPSIPVLLLHEHFQKAKLLALSKIKFSDILDYFLLNLSEFEQISYFYFILCKQLKSKQDNCMNNRRQMISEIEDERQPPFEIYPYMGKQLVKFFQIVWTIPLTCQNSFQKQISQHKSQILKASQICLRLNKKAFINYMVQLSFYYHLPENMLRLVQAVQIKPYVEDPKDGLYSNQSGNYKGQISQAFINNELLFMRSLINSINQGWISGYDMNSRQLILYEIKRIMLINQSVNRDSNQHRNELLQSPSKKSNFVSQRIPNPENPDCLIKQHLLGKCIQIIFHASKNSLVSSGLRLIQQIQDHILVIVQDKKLVNNLVQKLLQESREQQENKQKIIKSKEEHADGDTILKRESKFIEGERVYAVKIKGDYQVCQKVEEQKKELKIDA